MRNFAFATAASMTLIATNALAHDYAIGDLTIAHPVSYETAVTAQTGAGYMVVTNTGDTDDRLLAARADFPRVEVHEIVEIDDVMSMRELQDGLVIPAGGSVTLEPGGYHVMFMGLNGDPFEVGEEIPVVLVFENAGVIEVAFKVEERTGTEGDMDHGDMDHGETDHGDMDHGEMEMEGEDG